MRFLIGLDIDGTIVDDNSNLSNETIEYIKKISAQGNIVSIITGRPFRTSKHLYDQLGLKTPIGNYSGSSVHNPNDDSFEKVEFKMDPLPVIELVNKFKDGVLNGFCEIEEKVYLFKEDPGLAEFLSVKGGELIIGSYDIKEQISGAVLFITPESAKGIEKHLMQFKDLGFRYWRSLKSDEYYVLEIYTKLSSKAVAMEIIRKYYDIPHSRTIAIGDGTNDIEMLEYAHYSASMKNAPQKVEDAAKSKAGSNNEDGAIRFIQDILKAV